MSRYGFRGALDSSATMAMVARAERDTARKELAEAVARAERAEAKLLEREVAAPSGGPSEDKALAAELSRDDMLWLLEEAVRRGRKEPGTSECTIADSVLARGRL